MATTRVASLRAIDQLKDELIMKCKAEHLNKDRWGGYSTDSSIKVETALDTERTAIIAKISKEIEEYAVAKYAKYGVIIVPVCHRDDAKSGRLNVQLKAKVFPGTERLQDAFEKAQAAYRQDLKRIDDWHFNALQAIAKREALPELPTF